MATGQQVNIQQARGTVLVAVIILLAMTSLAVICLVMGGGRDQSATVLRINDSRALYACEAGLNMAIRELVVQVDEDGDGVIGSISNDGNAANDPAPGGGPAHAYVVATPSNGQITVVSRSRCGEARRKLTAVLD